MSKQKTKRLKKLNTVRHELSRKTKRRLRHTVSIFLLIVSVLYSIFRFAPVFTRLVQSVEDVIRSVIYYFGYLIMTVEFETTVQKIPEGMDTVLPLTLEEFKELLRQFWILFKNPATMQRFGSIIGSKIAVFAQYFSLLLFPAIMVGVVIYYIYSQSDKRKGETKTLKTYKQFRKKVLLRIKREIKTYWQFIKRKRYIWLFAIVWAYNFNLITIALEVVAFIFYASISGATGWLNIFVQIAKLAVDLSVIGFFLPSWLWVIIEYKVFDYIRRKMGDKKLKKYIDKVEEFLKKHPGALFVVGKQRSKKTSMLTMLKIVCERYFRKRAKSLFKKRDRQFPCFPWRSLERTV